MQLFKNQIIRKEHFSMFIVGAVIILFSLLILLSDFGNFGSGNIVVSKNNFSLNFSLASKKMASLYELPAFESKAEYVSEMIAPENNFYALAFTMDSEQPTSANIAFYLRTYDGKSWTDFELLVADEHMETNDTLKHYFYPVDLSEAYQYKIVLSTSDESVSPRVNGVSVTAIDASNVATQNKEKSFLKSLVSELVPYNNTSNPNELNIISRSDWGANEELGLYQEGADLPETDLIDVEDDFYDTYADELGTSKVITQNEDARDYLWPISYPESMKAVVAHHTDTQHDVEDHSAAVNEIYYYHTVVRGWGDIGYNFLIDVKGNIYEGRNGSKEALENGDLTPIAAHAGKFNNGTVGIALILDGVHYEPSLEAMDSLMTLTGLIFKTYAIDPNTQTSLRGKTLDRLIGHRDVMSTACPGDKFYTLLPDIRSLILMNFNNDAEDNTDVAYAFSDETSRSTISVKAQKTGAMKLTIKNTGSSTWTKNSSYLLLTKDYEAESKIYFTNKQGNGLAKFLMNEDDVKGGQSATFEIKYGSKVKTGFANFEAVMVFDKNNMSDEILFLPFYINKADLSYEILAQDLPNKLYVGDPLKASIRIQNTGDLTWNLDQYSKITLNSTLFGQKIIFDKVAPDEFIDIALQSDANFDIGNYEDNITLTLGKDTQLTGNAISYNLAVLDKNTTVALVEKPSKFYFDPSETYRVTMTFQNNTNDNLYPKAKSSKFNFRIIKNKLIQVKRFNILDNEIKNAEKFKVTFILKVPEKEGSYTVNLAPQIDNKRLKQDLIAYKFNVINQSIGLEEEPDMRVWLSGVDIENPKISSDKDFSLYIGNSKYSDLKSSEIVEIKKENNLLKVILPDDSEIDTSDSVRFITSSSGILEITNFDNKPSWDSSGTLNDNQYRGVLEFQIYADELRVINELSLESYLKGLGETSNSDNLEKIKTITVAARTYALYYINIAEKFPGAPYNLSDDPAVSQKYLGYGLELRSPNISKAVDDTFGEIVTYDGVLVKTPYFNASDGTYTKSAEEVWGWTDAPYLLSVSDFLCESDSFKGHGVGVSGCGASAMAEDGSDYKEILKYYYTGIELEKLY